MYGVGSQHFILRPHLFLSLWKKDEQPGIK